MPITQKHLVVLIKDLKPSPISAVTSASPQTAPEPSLHDLDADSLNSVHVGDALLVHTNKERVGSSPAPGSDPEEQSSLVTGKKRWRSADPDVTFRPSKHSRLPCRPSHPPSIEALTKSNKDLAPQTISTDLKCRLPNGSSIMSS